MAKFEWSEVFMSIEGEAKYAGHPTAYIRFTKCNFKCPGFNNPFALDTTCTSVLGFDPKDYKDIYSIPLITKGCDSIYSWDPKFSHMWHKGTEAELADALVDVLPHKSFINPNTGKRVLLSLTGGEPTLRAKFLPTLLNTSQFAECKHILIETNAGVPLSLDFVGDINQWLCGDPERKWTWSNSPKLSVSGEKWEDAIRPEIVSRQALVTGRHEGQSEQYFKFVCGPNESDFAEVERAMNAYYAGGVSKNVEIYIMPTACTEEQQQWISAKIAGMCIDRGYIYCHRIQNSVFGNGVGT
jgi:7-carboxy-7-deazaguanine synthase